VFCHKPTWGLLLAPGHALTEMDIGAIGPMTRSALDLSMPLELLAIPDPDDSRLSYTLPPGWARRPARGAVGRGQGHADG
jgi:Asp-tRNA(Asn)/Glu-tRNA(Gln) amidotransferase A subunit family amidase